MRAYRLNFTAPDGAQVGISIPAGVDPEKLIAEYEHIERQVVFGYARPIASIDGPPQGFRRRLRWMVRCTANWTRQKVIQLYTHTIGRAAAERKVAAFTTAFREALAAAQVE